MPSSPMRLSAGISMLSKKSALVEWFIIIRSGRTSSPLPSLADVDEEDAEAVGLLLDLVTGVVRARSSMRSDCSAREMNIFWPFTT